MLLEDIAHDLNNVLRWCETNQSFLNDTYNEENHANFSSNLAPVLEKIQQIHKNIKDNTSLEQSLEQYKKPSGDEAHLERRTLMRTSMQETQAANARIIEISIPDMTALQALYPNLSFGIHEIKTPLTSVHGFNQLIDKIHKKGNLSTDTYLKYKDTIENQINGMKEVIIEQAQRLNKEVKQNENVTIDDIKKAFEDVGRPQLIQAAQTIGKIQFDLDIAHDISTDVAAVWSKDRMRGLVQNCAQNWIRKYKAAVLHAQNTGKNPDEISKKVKITIKTKNDMLCLAFEDDGEKPFDDIFVTQGFIAARKAGIHGHGHTDVESTGIGMAGHEKAIAQFGGILKAENVFDENGRYIGARVIALLPKTRIQSEPQSLQ